MSRILIVSMIAVGCWSLGGCARDNAARQAKLEQDRAALRLADAERDRDSLKGQVEALRLNASQAIDRQREAESQLQTAQSRQKAAEADLASAIAAANEAQALKAKLKTTEQMVAEDKIRIEALQAQIKQLETALGASTQPSPAADASVSTTQPAMDMNK